MCLCRRGYSDAESTWEPVAFYEEHWSDLVKAYLQTRQPEHIVQKKLRISKSTSSDEEFEFYEVQWLGQKETTLERASLIDSQEAFRPLLEAWQKRQLDLESKRAMRTERAILASLPRPGKRTHAQDDEKAWTRRGRVKASELHSGRPSRLQLVDPCIARRCYAFSVRDLISVDKCQATTTGKMNRPTTAT